MADGAVIAEDLAAVNRNDGRGFGLVLLECGNEGESTNQDSECAAGNNGSLKRHVKYPANRNSYDLRPVIHPTRTLS